jgi:hypothetical protein
VSRAVELSDALRRVVERSGHRRFAELLGPDHPDYNPGYAEVVRALAAASGAWGTGRGAAGPAPVERPGPVLDLRTITRLKPLAAACLYAAQPTWRGCGCRECHARARTVSLGECLECVADLVPGAPPPARSASYLASRAPSWLS